MEKVKINMVGGGFQHAHSSVSWFHPKYVEWIKDSHTANISIHIDYGIMHQSNKTKRNFAWISEVSSINPSLFQWVFSHVNFLEENFEYIFTYDKRLLPLSNKMRIVPCSSKTWIIDPKIHNKSKMVSMFISVKKSTHGQAYRHEILRKYGDKVDYFGTGVAKYIPNKEEGLNDYYYSIAIENDNYPNCITEKIIDCFATGTIPIYWGTSAISEFFNNNGIIFLSNDLKIEDLSVNLYQSKMEYIKENFEIAIKWPITEDYIYENYIK